MTLEQAAEWLLKIRDLSDDDENAHSEEDHFREAVLQAIANGTTTEPIALATIALKTSELRFARLFS